MVAGRKAQPFMVNGCSPATQHLDKTSNSACIRNLRKNQLGGVIFGCKNFTIKECLFKQIFGLPAQHLSFVKNIEPGLPLFLFNYCDRKLHGIFEAASPGQMNINPYGWTTDGSEKTLYPAQVQIRVGLHCRALPEDQFKPLIADNYYNQHHFWFELDHAQTRKLIDKLSSVALPRNTQAPHNTVKWRTFFQPLPEPVKNLGNKDRKTSDSEVLLSSSDQSSIRLGSSDMSPFLNGDDKSWDDKSWDDKSWDDLSEKQATVEDEDPTYLRLKELALNSQQFDSPSVVCTDDTDVTHGLNMDITCLLDKQITTDQNSKKNISSLSDAQSVIARLVTEIEELKDFKATQASSITYLEKRLAIAEKEIQCLKDHCGMESTSNPLITTVDENAVIGPVDQLQLDSLEVMYLVGGHDGDSWLSALDSYSPSRDVIKKLQPMSLVRSFAAAAKLNGDLFIFGGGDGELWYDTVESYNPDKDQWTTRSSLKEKKGSLAGVTIDDKIFSIGGGNGDQCFADVEMFDADIGRWIPVRSMLQKRFALAAAELNGVMYATGGYDGNDYLKSVERFDPRHHSWTKIASMNTKRGCHSLVAMNDKLYAIGGFDGDKMIPTVEIYDPRGGSWVMGEPMKQCRGYSASVVIDNSIYVTGGLLLDESIAETVEQYKEGRGWQVTNLNAIGKRCYFSAIVL